MLAESDILKKQGKEGREAGRQGEKEDIAKKMLKDDKNSIEDISFYIGLSESRVNELKFM